MRERCVRTVVIAAAVAALFPWAGYSQAQKTNVAVITLKSTSGVSAGEAEIISDRLRAELFNTGEVNVMEREQMQDILKEQGFQASGACTDEACLVEMGQLLGVQRLITGSIGKLGSMFLVNLRAIDVQTGRIAKAVSRDVTGGIEEVVVYLRGIAKELVVMGSTAAVSDKTEAKPVPKQEAAKEEEQEEAAAEPEAEEAPEEEKAEAEPAGSGDKADKNRNRAGVRLSFAISGANFQDIRNLQTFDEYGDMIRDTSFSHWNEDFMDTSQNVSRVPFVTAGLTFMIKAGPFLTIDIGAGFERGGFDYSYDDGYYLSEMTERVNFMSMMLGLGFVKRIHPLKINVGAQFGGGMALLSEYWYDEEGGTVMTDSGYTDQGFGFLAGGRAGVEILAGSHVGFSLDMQVRYTRGTTIGNSEDTYDAYYNPTGTRDESRTFILPLLAAVLGVNFYF